MDLHTISIHKRELVILSLIALIIIIVFVVLQAKSNQPITQTPAPTTLTVAPTQTSNRTTTSPNKINQYENKYYAIRYPADWKAIEYQVNGSYIALKPKDISDLDGYPSLTISVKENTEGLAMQESLLQSLNLQKTESEIDGAPATVYRGVIPFKVVNGQNVSEPVRETGYLIVKDGRLYFLVYHYEGDKVLPEYEELFQKMVASFTFL